MVNTHLLHNSLLAGPGLTFVPGWTFTYTEPMRGSLSFSDGTYFAYFGYPSLNIDYQRPNGGVYFGVAFNVLAKESYLLYQVVEETYSNPKFQNRVQNYMDRDIAIWPGLKVGYIYKRTKRRE
jgi:hypothetical protein